MELRVKITIVDILFIFLIFFCLLVSMANAVGGWWFMSHVGFTVKQLLINLIVTSSALFMTYIVFKYVFVIKINKIK